MPVDTLRAVFGPDGDPTALTVGQMAARAALVYLFGLALLRAAGNRVLGRYAAIDVVVGIVLGAILSRAVNGTAPLLPTLAAGAGIVALHWALSAGACRSRALARLLKGRSFPLVADGRVLEGSLRRHHLGTHDLEEALRLAGHPADAQDVAEARLERNGRISVVGRPPPAPPEGDGAPGA